jgi:hypothetical protein
MTEKAACPAYRGQGRNQKDRTTKTSKEKTLRGLRGLSGSAFQLSALGANSNHLTKQNVFAFRKEITDIESMPRCNQKYPQELPVTSRCIVRILQSRLIHVNDSYFSMALQPHWIREAPAVASKCRSFPLAA